MGRLEGPVLRQTAPVVGLVGERVRLTWHRGDLEVVGAGF